MKVSGLLSPPGAGLVTTTLKLPAVARGNEVLVILGPFNDWMVAADQRPTLWR